jgi:hypothetical protein
MHYPAAAHQPVGRRDKNTESSLPAVSIGLTCAFRGRRDKPIDERW